MKQIAFNLYDGVCGTLHAIGGTHCPSNILPPQPHKVRPDGIYKCLTSHYHKVSPRNIFGGFQEQAFIVIQDEQSNSDCQPNSRRQTQEPTEGQDLFSPRLLSLSKRNRGGGNLEPKFSWIKTK